MAERQGQDVTPLQKAFAACSIPLERLNNEIVHKTLQVLPNYCREHNLPFGIAHTLREVE
jgi:hypothetical protein